MLYCIQLLDRRRKTVKYFIASDIHGSAYYCEKMIEAYRREGADRLVLLGDLLYHGPRNELPRDYAPKRVIEMLNALKNEIFCVRGNCDTEVDQMVLEFPILADYALLDSGARHSVFVTHGHKYNLESLPPLKAGDLILHGHTHVPACETRDGITYLNPGSVSIPKAGSACSYMLLENGVFTNKSLDGETVFSFSAEGC